MDTQKNNGLRHCMVVHSYYPYDETRVQRQAEALVKHGVKVDIICLHHNDDPKTEQIDGVTVYRLPVSRNKKRGPLAQFFEYLSFLIFAFFKLTILHLRRRYHIVQVHNLPDFLVFVALVPRLTGSSVILDLHDLMPEFYCAKFGTTFDSLPVRLIRWQEWLSCRFASHIITVTEAWRQDLINQRGIPADKCTVVMNVADPQYFYDFIAVEESHQNGHFRLIYHGNITHRYGLDLALQALARVRSEIPGVHLTVHGRGDYLETILELVKTLKLEDIVQIHSEYLPVDELPKRIKSAHIGLVPYRCDIFTDGILPTKLMEYTALGIPAVAARTPGISAYFDDTMVEFFTPEDVEDMAHHIRILYQDQSRLQTLAANTKKFNEKYNWPLQSAGYLNLVKKLAYPQR